MKVGLVWLPPRSTTRIYWCEASSSVDTQLPPLDLLYIASLLKERGIAVEVGEFVGGVDIAVFHVTQQTLDIDLGAIKTYWDYSAKTVVFGCGPTVDPEVWARYDFVDHVIIGEPEQGILDLCTGDAEGKVIHSPFIDDLDLLPFPDYDVLAGTYKCSYIEKSPWVISLSSRGCGYSCNFCSSHILFGRKFRPRSATNVVDEMLHFQSKGYKTIWYYDDTFTMDRNRVLDICHMAGDRGVSMGWKTQTRADRLDKKLIRAMRDAGCYELGIGVESGNHDILDKSGKALDLGHVRRTFAECRDVGMRTVAFFMLGMAHETKETVRQTIDFARKIDPTYAQFTLATPYLGTEFYNIAKKNCWFTSADYDCSGKYSLKMNDITADWIEGELARANRSFFLSRRGFVEFMRKPSFQKIRSAIKLVRK